MGFENMIKRVTSRKSRVSLREPPPAALPPPMPPMPPMPAIPSRSKIETPAVVRKPNKLPESRNKKQKITAEEMREFRELIRYRYKLDVEIWGQRGVKMHSRYLVEDTMRKSDAALLQIQKMVQGWDKRSYFSSDEEYVKFRDIKARIDQDGKRYWKNNPPWTEVGTNDKMTPAPYV